MMCASSFSGIDKSLSMNDSFIGIVYVILYFIIYREIEIPSLEVCNLSIGNMHFFCKETLIMQFAKKKKKKKTMAFLLEFYY